MYEDVRLLFDGVSTSELRDVEVDLTQTIDGDHGRIETRSAWAIADHVVISSLRGLRERIASWMTYRLRYGIFYRLRYPFS